MSLIVLLHRCTGGWVGCDCMHRSVQASVELQNVELQSGTYMDCLLYYSLHSLQLIASILQYPVLVACV
jgi:Flp pilus assembly CpaE family ATPase